MAAHGDVAELVQGQVKIVDRLKDIMITAGGKNLSPSEIENRLKVYADQTSPLIEHYRSRGLLKVVNADQPVDRVYAEFVKVAGL